MTEFICDICGAGSFKSSRSVSVHKQWKHDEKSAKNHAKGAKSRWTDAEKLKQSARIHEVMESGGRQVASDGQKARWKNKHEEIREKYQKGWTDEAKAFCNSYEGAMSVIHSFDHKPSVKEIKEAISLDSMSVYRAIYAFDLQSDIIDSTQTSSGETELSEYIQSRGFDVRHDRKAIGKGLDIYVESKKFAIEYNGSYWHSDKFLDKTYHLNKTEACNKAGIRLVHVFDWQWQEDKNKVTSLIDSVLGLDEPVYARKTDFCKINMQDAKKFLDENHLQSYAASSYQYALVEDDSILAVMTFGRPRFNSFDGLELIRFATKAGIRIIGGESKLFKNAMKAIGCSSVLSYCDRSKFTGSGYEKLGFKHVRDTAPSYWWVKGIEHIPRYRTQMKDEDKIMRSNGYNKIFDCGNSVYEWRAK